MRVLATPIWFARSPGSYVKNRHPQDSDVSAIRRSPDIILLDALDFGAITPICYTSCARYLYSRCARLNVCKEFSLASSKCTHDSSVLEQRLSLSDIQVTRLNPDAENVAGECTFDAPFRRNGVSCSAQLGLSTITIRTILMLTLTWFDEKRTYLSRPKHNTQK